MAREPRLVRDEGECFDQDRPRTDRGTHITQARHHWGRAVQRAWKRRPGVRTLSALFVGALVVVAALVAEGSASSGRPTAGGSRTLSMEAEPTPGMESDDEISGGAEWFYEQRAGPAAQTPPGALARAERQAKALRTSPQTG